MPIPSLLVQTLETYMPGVWAEGSGAEKRDSLLHAQHDSIAITWTPDAAKPKVAKCTSRQADDLMAVTPTASRNDLRLSPESSRVVVRR